MRIMRHRLVALLAIVTMLDEPLHAQVPAGAGAGTGSVDLKMLVGKHLKVGRLPLCAPATYSVDLKHAGQMATVAAFVPNTSIAMSSFVMARMPPNMKPLIEDTARGGMMTFQFDDGTTLDTCANLGLGTLVANLE